MTGSPVSAAWLRRCHALDDAIDRALAESRVVGALLVVTQHGETVYQRAAGLADREARRPMAVDTLFRYSSLAKPIVSAAAMVLVERGILGLGQPVTRWIPSFRPRLARGEAPTITVHHLLTHTSGLSYPWNETSPDGPYHRTGIGDGIKSSGRLTLDENLERIASVPLDFDPGSAWQYSVGIDVLGAVIEHATGEDLPAAVARLVTGPLGMADTSFRVADPARLASAYGDAQPEPALMREGHTIPGDMIVFSPGRAFDADAFPSGGSGMVGSGPNFVRFLEVIRTGGSPVLTQPTTELMMSSQIGSISIDDMPGVGFGYGGAVIDDPVAAQVPCSPGTWWWGGVYGHRWFVDPVAGVTVVLLTNTAFEGLWGQLTEDIRSAAYL